MKIFHDSGGAFASKHSELTAIAFAGQASGAT
ncbi:MAG: hypothetical protein QG650_459 [Patescibacteria group bacterium]|nr:hypothetical protein [Patescibacteria group bacterium]